MFSAPLFGSLVLEVKVVQQAGSMNMQRTLKLTAVWPITRPEDNDYANRIWRKNVCMHVCMYVNMYVDVSTCMCMNE